MSSIHYQYSLTNFVVFDEYEDEVFNEENQMELHRMILRTFNYSLREKKQLSGELRTIFASEDIIKTYLMENQGARSYNPLSDTPELYLELYKVQLFNEKTLKKFIKEYGIPFDEYSSGFGTYNSNLFKKNNAITTLRVMDVLSFYQKLQPFKDVVKLWDAIKQNDEVHLIQIKEEFSFYANFNLEQRNGFIEGTSEEQYLDYVCADLGIVEDEEREIIKGIFMNDPEQLWKLQIKASSSTKTWEEVKNLSDKEIALAYLNLKLNDLESGSSATKYIDGKIVPAIAFKNLLEVAAFQLKKAIFNDTELQECLLCGALFEPKHAHQKFCSPLPGRVRSTCENTYNQRLKRQRRKEKEMLNEQ